MSWRDLGRLPVPPAAFYARLNYHGARQHERYRRYVEAHGLMCQECSGWGQVVHDVVDFGGPECGSIPYEIMGQCGWCEGTGKVTRHARGLWLRCKREDARRERALLPKEDEDEHPTL